MDDDDSQSVAISNNNILASDTIKPINFYYRKFQRYSNCDD